MNTSLQLYNATLSPYMCPLWPEIPSMEAVLAPPAAGKNSIFNTITDYMPKTWDDAVPYFSKGFLLNECIVKWSPVNCISILAAKILPRLEHNSQNSTDSLKKYQGIPRYLAYNLEIKRQIYWLLPCTLAFDRRSCAKYFMYGAGSQALKLAEKKKMPTPLTVANFLFKQTIHAQVVYTALSCVGGSWETCIKDAIKVLAGKVWISYCENEDA